MSTKNISAVECKKIMDEKPEKLVLLDVRGHFECEEGKIENSLNIPLNELESRTDELLKYEDIIVYCASGNRSKRACNFLDSLNLNDCMNLDGGIFAWHQAGYEVI